MNILFPAGCYGIVGSNVGAPGTEALHILECDNVTGAAKIVQTVKGIGAHIVQLAVHFNLSEITLCEEPYHEDVCKCKEGHLQDEVVTRAEIVSKC